MTSEFTVSHKTQKTLNTNPTSLPTLPKHHESPQAVPRQLAGTNASSIKGAKGKAAQLQGVNITGFDRTLLGSKKLWH